MNASYCRFENTYNDLRDCLEALDNAPSVEALEKDSNEYERKYIRKLIELCEEIAGNYGNQDDWDD
jgi:hypothetical protein